MIREPVLVTGADGFIGRHVVHALWARGTQIRRATKETAESELVSEASDAQTVIHLAGVNRCSADDEFVEGNVALTRTIVSAARQGGRVPRIVFTSSTQASLDSPYGRSKREAEVLLLDGIRAGIAKAAILRLPGVFGKWSRPFYNSVVATFCFQAANNIPFTIHNSDDIVSLLHIDDAVNTILDLAATEESGVISPIDELVRNIRIGDLAYLIDSFVTMRSNAELPKLADDFERKLHSTFTSFLPRTQLSYSLLERRDNRGRLAEFLRGRAIGQIFVSTTRPGVTRGNHWHHSKVEKFLVLSGTAVIRLEGENTQTPVEYLVDGSEWKVVDIPPGVSHQIENVGTTDLVVLFWANEPFAPSAADTFARDLVHGQ